MMLTLMLTSKGVAGVPRGALVVLTAALGSFGLPLEGAAILLGIDQILDMGRTAVNVTGNCLATAVVARWEGVLDDRQIENSDETAGRRCGRQLGSTFADTPGHDVIGLTRADVDVTDQDALLAVVERIRPDVLVNCTAYNNVDGAEDDATTALAVNAFAVRSLAAAAAGSAPRSSTTAPTSCSMARPSRRTPRAIAPAPLSVYGCSKLLGEWFAARRAATPTCCASRACSAARARKQRRQDRSRDPSARPTDAGVRRPDRHAELCRGRGDGDLALLDRAGAVRRCSTA